MKLDKIIVISLIIKLFITVALGYVSKELLKIIFEFWNSPFFDYDSIFFITYPFKFFLFLIADIFICIGVFKIIKEREIKLYAVFKFPIFLFTYSMLKWIMAQVSYPQIFFLFIEQSNWFVITFKALQIILLGVIVFYFSQKANVKNIELSSKGIGKDSRVINYLIDITIIMLFAMPAVVFPKYPYLDIYLDTFLYYFFMEFLFHQTIGKLHNNSFVSYKGNRLPSILIRTFCRFIPFNPLSFFGKEGWHDKVSETTVVVEEKQKKTES